MHGLDRLKTENTILYQLDRVDKVSYDFINIVFIYLNQLYTIKFLLLLNKGNEKSFS